MVLLGEKKIGEGEKLVEQVIGEGDKLAEQVTKTEEIQSPTNISIKQQVSSDFEKIPSPEEVAKFLPEVVISGGWNKCWVEDVTPWDLGRPTPLVVRLVETGALPKGRGLVPGCGGGHDVVAMASSERFVVGLDISENARKKAVEMHSSGQNAAWFSFVLEDFFTWRPTELFDFIFDYVFFCAIEPDMRAAWGKSMSELLKPDGELITLMYPIGEHEGGPPYKVSVSDYEEVLIPLGFRPVSVEDNELAVGPRKGKEKLGRWKKMAAAVAEQGEDANTKE